MFNNPSIDPWDLVANAELTTRNPPYIIEGIYPLLYIDKIVSFVSKKTRTQKFVVEFEIIESNVEKRPSGTRMSFHTDFSWPSAPSDIKAFFTALTGANPEDITPSVCKMAVGAENPCRGMLIRAEAYDKENTKEPGRVFTNVKWVYVPKETQEKAEELRKEAGFM